MILVAGHITNVRVNPSLHRAQTHRSVRFHYRAELPMCVWLWLTTGTRAKEWFVCLRKAVRHPGVREKYGKGTLEAWLELLLLDKRSPIGIVRKFGSISTCSGSSWSRSSGP